MENSECCVGEDVSLTPDATDDSCIAQFIEIVPVHISRKDFPNTAQVKDEFTADIKQEPEDLCEVYGTSAVNVSLCVSLVIISNIADLLYCIVLSYGLFCYFIISNVVVVEVVVIVVVAVVVVIVLVIVLLLVLLLVLWYY